MQFTGGSEAVFHGAYVMPDRSDDVDKEGMSCETRFYVAGPERNKYEMKIANPG